MKAAAAGVRSTRIAAIDWMRGLVMVLMVIDHASMAFDGSHLSDDSALYPEAATMALPAAEFFTRWITHLCAPTFVFLAARRWRSAWSGRSQRAQTPGRSTADSHARRDHRPAGSDDSSRSGPGAGRSRCCLAIGARDDVHGAAAPAAELGARRAWSRLVRCRRGPHSLGLAPAGSSSILAAFLVAAYGGDSMIVKYPVVPWLAMMMLGWVFGRHLIQFGLGESRAPAGRGSADCGNSRPRRVCHRPLRGRLRRHVPASRRRFLAAVAARQQVPAVDHLYRAGTGPAVRDVSRRS